MLSSFGEPWTRKTSAMLESSWRYFSFVVADDDQGVDRAFPERSYLLKWHAELELIRDSM
jgi:hypothetical protein